MAGAEPNDWGFRTLMHFRSSTRIAAAIVGLGAMAFGVSSSAWASVLLPDPNPRRFVKVQLPDPNPLRPKTAPVAKAPAAGSEAEASKVEDAAAPTVAAGKPVVVEEEAPAAETPPPAKEQATAEEPMLAGPLDAGLAPPLDDQEQSAPQSIGLARTNAAAKDDAVPTTKSPPLKPSDALPPKPDYDFDTALRPLLSYRLSERDKANLKGTLNAVYRGKISEADRVRKKIKDKTARKVADWYFLRKSHLGASAAQIEAFRVNNPEWPSQKLMRRRAEYSLFVARPPAEKVLAFFAERDPSSGEGYAALAEAHRANGDVERANQLIVKAWREYKLDKKSEKLIRSRFKGVLTNADHRARIDKLLYADRKSRLARAKRTASLISKAERKKVDARAAVVQRSRRAGRLLSALSKEAKAEPGVYFSRIQYHRRKKKYDRVWKMWVEAPTDPKKIADINEWWVERRIAVRRALISRQHKLAFTIAKNHGPVTGKALLDAKFMTGWIALRFLDDPNTALTNFNELAAAAKAPRRVARAEYWLGRTKAVLGKTDEADAHFKKAAEFANTYYGQIAIQSLSATPVPLKVKETPLPTKQDVANLMARDAAKAIGVARAAGLKRLAPLFLFQLARTLESPGEVALLAILARRLKMPQASVRLSKIAYNRGLDVSTYAFPTDMIPKYRKLNDGIEPALLFALSRQESEFNPKAKSHAGARGLMQIMPRTARAIARSYKVRYRLSNLTGRPSYNVMLGAAHLRDLIDGFKGSYIMTLAAYNAGGPRVREWAGKFGDPRSTKVDPIDWVELIPFTETRRYVQKILPSIQIYRARIEGDDNSLQILQDLSRGRSVPIASTAVIDVTGATPAQN